MSARSPIPMERLPRLFRSTFRGGRLFLILALSAYMVSCRCEEEHPYTPFSVTTSLPDPVSADAASGGGPLELPSARKGAIIAPPEARRWQVEGLTLEAPPGLVFVALARLEMGDLAWLTWAGKPQTGEAPGVFRVEKNGNLTRVLGVPSALPQGPDCTLEGGLEPLSPRTAAFRVSARCETTRLLGTPEQALVILDALSEAPPFGVLWEALPPGERLEVSANPSDTDGDGQEDRGLEFHLWGPEGAEATMAFSWLGRAAGPSRRIELPSREFADAATALAQKAIRKKERALVPAKVDALRRAFSAICAESERARIRLLDNSRPRCEKMDAALVTLGRAKVDAYLGLGKPLAALGEVLRADYFGAGPSARQKEALGALIAKQIPTLRTSRLVELSGPFAAGGWLSFDQAGRVWLHTSNSEDVVWPAEAKPNLESPADESTLSQTPHPVSPDPRIGPGGRKLQAALPSCDRSEITLVFQTSEGALPPVPTRLLAPRPGDCDSFGRGPLPARVIEFNGGETLVLVAGEPVSTSGAAVEFRVPHAWHTALGLVVADGKSTELWLTGEKWLSHECALDTSKARAACLHDGRIAIYGREGDPR